MNFTVKVTCWKNIIKCGPTTLSGMIFNRFAFCQFFNPNFDTNPIRFFEEYQKFDLNFWGLTAQNEPIDGRIPGTSKSIVQLSLYISD